MFYAADFVVDEDDDGGASLASTAVAPTDDSSSTSTPASSIGEMTRGDPRAFCVLNSVSGAWSGPSNGMPFSGLSSLRTDPETVLRLKPQSSSGLGTRPSGNISPKPGYS